jgi:hypothetical protein
MALEVTLLKMNVSVFLVAAITVDLAADFATGPSGAVNVHVSGARTNCPEQFIKLSCADAALISEVSNVNRRDRA